MKSTNRYLPLTISIIGYIVPLFLIGFGVWYGVWMENRTSGDGPNNIVWMGILTLPVLQLYAIFLGIRVKRTTEGKIAIITALITLLWYAGYWLRWWL